MDYTSSSSSAPVTAASHSNGISGDSKSGRGEAAASLSPSAAQVVSTVLEDDLALPVTSGLATEASLLFQSGKYAECVNVLRQLLLKKENDPKVHHNIAIAESLQDGCLDPKKLIEKLNDVKKKSEELAILSEEQADASNTGNKVSGGSNRNNFMMQHSSGTSNSSAVFMDEYNTSVTMFNLAVVWFDLHEYAKSFSNLDRLFQNIEPINEATALHICLLLLDVGLLSKQFCRCVDVIAYVERVFCVNSSPNLIDNGNSAQQHPTQGSKSVLLPSNAIFSDSLNPDSSDAHLLESLSEEGLEDDSFLSSSLDINGQDLQRTRTHQPSIDLSRTQTEDSMSTIDLRLKLHLYKVRFLLATRNLKAAKREVKNAIKMTRGKDNTLALYLKSQIEYDRMNHQKAIKLLMASVNRAETEISSIFLNNLGCIYHRIGKFHTSTVLFSKALSCSSYLRKEKPPKLSSMSQDNKFQMLYNCGVNFLASGKPFPAVRCFEKASVVFYNKPLLWLRIAECSLLALAKGLIKSSYSASDSASDVVVHVIGKGKWRQLTVEGRISRNGQFDVIERQDKLTDLSITFANQCLLNAMILLEVSDSESLKSDLATEGTELADSVASKGTTHMNRAGSDSKTYGAAVGAGHASVNGEAKELKGGLYMSFMNSIFEYEDFCRKGDQMVKQAVLADLAYVKLELGNPVSALSIAKSLLKLPECSRVYIFLGNLYAAEALCMLNRPKEASEHLHTYVLRDTNNSVELPYSQDDIDEWGVPKIVDTDELPVNKSLPNESQGLFLQPTDALGTLKANLAAVLTVEGELERAQEEITEAMSILPNSPHVILTAIFLDMVLGRTHDAIAKLKECNRIKFVPSNYGSS